MLLIPQRYEFSSKSQLLVNPLVMYPGCCWYHKGTNFQANHNWCIWQYSIYRLLLIPQRYEFSSKSQQYKKNLLNGCSCCWYHKGTNFQANHNWTACSLCHTHVVVDTTKVRIFKQITTCGHELAILMLVVVDTTKVRIFKQITTICRTCTCKSRLLLIPQRYEFSSKSQHARGRRLFKICCCWYHKGTNFQANHNQHSRHSLAIKVVVDTTKVRIFKQITTDVDKKIRPELLLLIPQRYEFSSKSQRFLIGMCAIYRCCWYHKGTNFQANHNTLIDF